MQHEVDKILQVGDQHNFPHWKVYYGTDIKRQQIYCSSENIVAPETSITWDSSRPTLETYLNLLPGGTYTIHFKQNLTDKSPSDIRNLVFKITDTANTPAVTGLQPVQPQNNFSPQFMMQYMQAEIGKATANIELRATKEEFERKLEKQKEDYERKLSEQKKKKESSFDFQGLTGLIKEGKQAYIEFLAANKLQQTNKPAIAIQGSTTVVPADAAGKDKQEEDEEKFMLTDELKALDGQTIGELIEIFGSAENVVIELYAMKEFVKEHKDIYDTLVSPQLAKYKTALNETGIITGN